MKALVQEKELAIELRKQGLSYKEILERVPVAKSTLSLWVKDLPLTKDERAVLRSRTDKNISRGRIKAASELRKRRLVREKAWHKEAQILFDAHKDDPLFHTGIALYWAEGAKRVNQWSFMNSDVDMIRVMQRWLVVYTSVPHKQVEYRLYVHRPYLDQGCEHWWCQQLHVGEDQFLKTVIKPTQRKVKKRPQYKGCIRMEVRKSKYLLCKMKFWREMQVEYYLKR